MTATFTWKMKDSGVSGDPIELCSPTLRIGCYEFRLVLNIPGLSNESVRLTLTRLDDLGEELVTVKYQLALQSTAGGDNPIISRFVHDFKKNDCWEQESDFLKKDVFETNGGHSAQDCSVIFSCFMRVKEKTYRIDNFYFVFDSESLSRSLGEILKTGEYSDMVLVAQGVRFQAHKIVLKTRCPKLWDFLEETEHRNEYLLRDVRPTDLQNILRFLYTGTFDVENINKDLPVLLDRYCLGDLKNKAFRRYHQHLEAESSLHVSVLETKFTWAIEDFRRLQPSQEVLHCVPAYVTAENEWCKMDVVLSVTDEGNAEIIFKNGMGSDIGFVHYKLTFGEDFGITIDGVFYASDLICVKTLKFQELVELTVRNCLNIFCELELHSKKMNSHAKTRVEQRGYGQRIVSVQKLQRDFYHVVHERKHAELSDVTLKSGDVEFRVHKAFLCCRSPMFARMFEHDFLEKRENLVNIEDVAPEALSSVLHYLYCGGVNKMNGTEAVNLYAAADKYELLDLKEKCSERLRKLMDAASAGEVLRIADLHRDENLKKFVYDYIAQNPKSVLYSEGRFNENPELLKEVLKRMFFEVEP